MQEDQDAKELGQTLSQSGQRILDRQRSQSIPLTESDERFAHEHGRYQELNEIVGGEPRVARKTVQCDWEYPLERFFLKLFGENE